MLKNLLTRGGGNRVSSVSSLAIVVLVVALVIISSILVHVLFSRNVNELTVELLAAIIAVVLVVASVGVTIHFQVRSETEREYRVELFRQKFDLYKETIKCITKADDDGQIDKHEIEQMRNNARLAALVGKPELVKSLADFVTAVEKTGSITKGLPPPPEEDDNWDEEDDEDAAGTFRSVLQEMRNDLGVVEGGDVRNYVKTLSLKS